MGLRLGFVVAVGALWLGSCATPPGGPAYEVSADCQIRAIPGSGGEAGGGSSPGGFSIGFGGLIGGGASTPKYGCDGPCPESSHSGGASLGVGVDLGQLFRSANRRDPATPIRDGGPALPSTYSMSCLPVRCLMKGNWPMVVDYGVAKAGTVTVEVRLESGGPPFIQRLDGSPGRHLVRFDLPASLGSNPQPALLLVRGDEAAGRVQLYGLGAGPKAVGSVAIDQVDFGPPALRRAAKETARYSFFSRSDFNRVSVNVLRVQGGEGAVRVSRVREFDHPGGVSRGTRFGPGAAQPWDGTDERNQTSPGLHLLQVRAWASAADEGDWVTAWSGGGVQVRE